MLFEPYQLRQLQDIAEARGESVGALIRKAVEMVYLEHEQNDRLKAVRELAAMSLPVADWEHMERESIETVCE